MTARLLFVLLLTLFCSTARSQQRGPEFTRQDTLFGSNTLGRAWWDVQRYDLEVTPDFASKTLRGRNTISYTVLTSQQPDMQIDLQEPMQVDSIYYNGVAFSSNRLKSCYREGNHYFIPLPKAPQGSTQKLTIVFHGQPKEAKNAPWDGGWVWTKDKQGRPWMSVACEGDGASLWYPCKDLWSDEPDKGASLTVLVEDSLVAVGNGRLTAKQPAEGKTRYTWEVKSPINAYNIVPYIGHYTSWADTLMGEKGKLDLTYWTLDYEKEKARIQFAQVKLTLRAFENWFGPYPFYADGYQLVQSPYLGMEHQSAVAYGNEFKNGYLGTDLSGTGWGLKWDYIIVHETGHEWFGNNITAKDPADMWVHEGFTTYSETLFTETYYGKVAAEEYTQGLRRNIQHDKPIIGTYGVRREGSGDMYFKGSNIIHTIRQLMGDDEKFRLMLRGLQKDFYQSTVTTKQVEDYISSRSGKNLGKIFDQYLRTTNIPTLEYRQSGNTVRYRWANTITGFAMPVKLTGGQWITPTADWQSVRGKDETFSVDKNFYINVKKL